MSWAVRFQFNQMICGGVNRSAGRRAGDEV
jgi:hypothetical protein